MEIREGKIVEVNISILDQMTTSTLSPYHIKLAHSATFGAVLTCQINRIAELCYIPKTNDTGDGGTMISSEKLLRNGRNTHNPPRANISTIAAFLRLLNANFCNSQTGTHMIKKSSKMVIAAPEKTVALRSMRLAGSSVQTAEMGRH